MIKKVPLIVLIFLVLTGLYLVFPPLSSFSTEKSVSVVPTNVNNVLTCKSDTIYVTKQTREIHQGEGYAFVVDDNCAELQKNLVNAIQNDDLDEIRHLISMGANVQTADWSMLQPTFPLQIAVYKSADVIKLLLDNGADVNKEYCCCASCSSPLTTAIYENRPETVQLLLEHGAYVEYRPTFTDGEKLSPLESAVERGNWDIIDLVRNTCEETLVCRIKSRAGGILHLIRI